MQHASTQKMRIIHSPTLNTVLMVEHTLKDSKEIMKISELKRRLPRKVVHATLLEILNYLQESGKILITTKGVVWTYTPNDVMEKLKKGGFGKMEEDGLEISELKGKMLPILKDHGVVKAAIFGSVARGEAKADSDIDILVEFKETPSLFGLGGLYAELRRILGRRPDIVTYNSINSRIRQNIMRDKVDIL
jgi:predicted nucleotidyltransferase